MKATWQLLRDAAELWYDRDGDRLAAVVSYYAVFALIPLMLAIVTLVGFFFGEAVVADVLRGWGSVLGQDLVALLQEAVANLRELSSGFGVPVVGSLFFLGITIMGFNELAQGFHELWSIPHQGFRGFVKKSVSAILFILFLCVFVAVIAALASFVNGSGVARFSASVFLLAVLFAVAYRLLPYYKLPVVSALVGGAVASVLFTLTKLIIAYYVSFTPFPDLYGTAGLVVALLIWVFASAAIIYYGAAVAYVHAHK